MSSILSCFRPDVIVLTGDAGFHKGLLGEYRPDGRYGGKRRYKFCGPPYEGRTDIFLMWSAVDNMWVIKAPRDTSKKLASSITWISCKPIIRNGPGTEGPHLVPRGNWVIRNRDQDSLAPKLLVVKTRPGGGDKDLESTIATKKRDVDYYTAKKLCRYLGWMGAHQFYMGRTLHGFAMMQSLGFFGVGWATDVLMFDSLYVEPPPPPAADSPQYQKWLDTYGEPAPAPTSFKLPFGLRFEFHDTDVARAITQFAFAWVYELAFRVFLQYSAETYMIVWAFRMIGCCVAVWLIGSIGSAKANMADLAKAFAVCVFMCAMIFRLPIWAPQYATLLRIFIIFLYYITRRVRVQKGYVFSLQGDAASSAESKQTNDVVPKARVAHDAKRSLILAVGFQIVFVALAAISYVNNTLIKCAYRETLSLRELVVIAVKEHGLNIPKVLSLTRNLAKVWREDCWDGLYKYLEKPTEGDVLYEQYTRPFEILGVPPTATLKEVKRAYRKLALEHHPDKNTEDFSDDVFVQIQEAYAKLKKRFLQPDDNDIEL